MTEEEWLASHDGAAMVDFVMHATVAVRTRWHGLREAKRFAISERKWRLLVAAVVRRIAHWLPPELCEKPLELLDRAADSKDVSAERKAVQAGLTDMQSIVVVFLRTACAAPLWQMAAVLRAACQFRWQHAADEAARQAELVRCVLGNPFHPASFDPTWLAASDGAAQRIAQVIYDGRVFTDLPILADALEEAGCAEASILTHCRTPGLHARGCWVVDGVLGKQ